MTVIVSEHGVSVRLTKRETEKWANRPGSRWPCSQLAGKALWACFDKTGLVDMSTYWYR